MFAVSRRRRLAWTAAGASAIASGLVLAFATTGIAATTPITEFTQGVGTAPGALTDGPDGNLWFVDSGAIGRITPSGQVTEFSSGLNPGSEPHAIVAGPGGNLWFSDVGTTKALGEITPSGTITEFAAGTHGLDSTAVPYDMTAGPDGSVWFTDIGTTRAIGEVSANGTITEYAYSTDVNDLLNAITEGPDGNLYVAVQGNNPTVTVVNASTGTLTKKPVTTVPDYPNDITAGPDGNVWFDGNVSVSRLAVGTNAITDFGTTAGMQANAVPDAMTAGPDGNVWFIDQYSGHDAVGRVTPAGAITEFPITGTPWDLTTGIDGNLWVPMSLPTAVDRVTPSGAVTAVSSGFDAGADLSETNIVVGPDGNLWMIDGGTPKAIVRADVMLGPVAATGAASAISTDAATVAGTVKPQGSATTAVVDYGTTPALGSSAAAGTLAASDTATAVSAPLAGLPAGTRIYYRVRATNGYGTSSGAVGSFTTASSPTGGGPGTGSTPRTVKRRLQIGNRRAQITVSMAGPACLARTTALRVSLRVSTLAGRHVIRGRIGDALLYLDRGVAHRHHVRRHGHARTVVAYTPNATVHRLPAQRTLRLMRLAHGRHTLRITVEGTQSVHRDGRQESQRVSRTARVRFRVC